MGLLFVSIFFWGLIFVSVCLSIWGLWKKSWKAFVWSGTAFVIPSIILATQKGLLTLFILLPLLSLVAAYLTYKGQKR
ncbi:hypothetical protein [Niallia endozanthoxylica]|uniref:Uncharacterized protein n=1 Tax=Niallia endozanthoxylica TaxID=2036016 RepID=A0A5J5HSH3_9BACI|nr:hypothetical protein [Niallia endozanthoxylica]KAA9023826.1 hypothetical protein F4V44_11835 [Niallia endozanthoxylica]